MSRKDTALRYFREIPPELDLRIQTGIELNRKGNATIWFGSKSGTLPENVTVEIEQIDHEFKFGANLFMLDEFENEEKNRIYRQKFAEVFNLATLPFYWNGIEPEEGKTRYTKDAPKLYRRPAPDLCLEYCEEKGIEPKCHCLNYDITAPDWIKDAPVPVVKEKLMRRFQQIAERYADRIPSFEVTNETLNCTQKTKFAYEDDFCEWSYRMADRFFPNNRLIINDYSVWGPDLYNNRQYYFMQIERLLRNGITHLDSIGMQYHSFFPLEREEDKARQLYNPVRLYQLMDCYAKLGLKEQITEMTIPAYGDDEENEWVQAEIIRNVFRTFFSHPAMEAIIYWNLVDGYAAGAKQGDMTQGENVYYGGLLRHDMSEKPAFGVLRDLIRNEWHTSTTATMIGNKVSFRGFYGKYRLRIHADEKTVEKEFSLLEKGKNQLSIDL